MSASVGAWIANRRVRLALVLSSLALGGAIHGSVALATTGASSNVGSSAAAQCYGGQISRSIVAAVLILKQHDMSCPIVKKIALALLARTPKDENQKIFYGYRCHFVNINAGGGAEWCGQGSKYVEYGFE